MTYLFNLLVAVDQLGNALCGGNPDCTISARIGYNAGRISGRARRYWLTVESIVDFTFWPLDGDGHCKQAYEADKLDTEGNNNGSFFRLLMTLVIVVTCIPISALLYTLYGIKKLVTRK